jgi:hypothetical protein
LNANGLVWDGIEQKSSSFFVKSLSRLLDVGKRSHNIVKEGFQVIVGLGDGIRFWKDLRWDSVPMMAAFPRIYTLASNKNGVIKDYGRFEGSKWVWDVRMRRQLFD